MAKNSKQTKPNKRFDENKFVQDFVEGKLALADLAKEHGRTLKQVNDILAGRNRKWVLARIERAIAFGRQRTLRQLAALQDDAVCAMARAVKGQADTVSLTAAKEILNRSLDIELPSAPKAGHNPTAQPASFAPTKMPREAKRRILTELDGPQPEP
jgi:hypothetical protein